MKFLGMLLHTPTTHKIFGYIISTVLTVVFLTVGLTAYENILERNSSFKGIPLKDEIRNGTPHTYGFPIFLNRYGFRDSDFITPKPLHRHRVMVLGDSFTFGYGMNIEQTYPKVAEQILKSYSKDIEIIVFAKPGFSIQDYAELLEKHFLTVQPDQIVIGFCFNDVVDRREYPFVAAGEAAFKQQYLSLFQFAQGLSLLGFHEVGSHVNQAIMRWGVTSGRQPSWMSPIEIAYDTRSEEWLKFRENLQRIKTVSDTHHLPAPIFSILNQGASHSEAPNFLSPSPPLSKFMKWWQQAKEEATRQGFFTYDHIHEIQTDLPNRYLGINALDWHPSVELHALYARKLALNLNKALRNDP